MKPFFMTLLFASMLTGCATSEYDPHVAAVENQLQARTIQTRDMNAASYQAVVVAVISTLQDYHFRIVDIDPELGTITAYQSTARDNPLGGRTSLSVLIREQDESRFRVRMNLSLGLDVEHTPELYQQFFAALHRKLHVQTSTFNNTIIDNPEAPGMDPELRLEIVLVLTCQMSDTDARGEIDIVDMNAKAAACAAA